MLRECRSIETCHGSCRPLRTLLLLAACAAVFPGVAEAGPSVYVAATGSARVLVIDTESNSIVATIPVDPTTYGLLGLAITPDGSSAYVASYVANKVYVINLATRTITAAVPVGYRPREVVITPDGTRAYVANMGGPPPSCVSVIDTASNTVVATIPVHSVGNIEVTPDGRFVYVTGNKTEVIDVSSNTVVGTLPISGAAYGIAFTPDGAFVYITQDNRVKVVNTATRSVVATIPVGYLAWEIAITPDGASAYVTASYDSVSVIDTATRTVVATIPSTTPAKAGTFCVAISPDGTRAYLTHHEEPGSYPPSHVSVIDTKTRTVVATIPVEGSGVWGVAVAPRPPNAPPTGNPTGGGVYEAGHAITLGGTVSDDDGDLLSFEWREGSTVHHSGTVQTVEGGTPVALPAYAIPEPGLSVGVHVIQLVIDDEESDEVVSEITVEVIDTTAPTLAPCPSHGMLWPPNHELVTVTIAANAADPNGSAPQLAASVTSDEPDEGLGDGDTANDIQNLQVDSETGTITVDLRVERSGTGDGRTYTITLEATDASGNSSMAEVTVLVPHSKGKK